jgi:hypothetical protein
LIGESGTREAFGKNSKLNLKFEERECQGTVLKSDYVNLGDRFSIVVAKSANGWAEKDMIFWIID